MSASPPLQRWSNQARRRVVADVAWIGLPLVAASTVVLALCGAGSAVAAGVALAGLAFVALVAASRQRRHDLRWVARQLDARRRDMDDSAALLLAGTEALSPLQHLQRSRLQQRLSASPPPDLRPSWSRRAIALAWAVAVLAVAAASLWPVRPPASPVHAPAAHATAVATPALVAQRLSLAPPAYTGLPARTQAGLDAKAPQGTRLQWTLRFQPQPDAAELVFLDGTRLPLVREGEDWNAASTLRESALYRIAVAGIQADSDARPYRLDAVADTPPQVRVIEPDRSPVLLSAGQRSWAPVFEASDDHGIAGNAQLRITLTQGSGENISFREQAITVPGRGDATTRRYAPRLDLAALGMAPGDDLVVQLAVRDNRAPQPQSASSPSVILRWPAHLDEAGEGMEVMVRKVLPAYFRSQRQIIIDAEALQKEKPRLAAETFMRRSDAIGVDQRILRLRYGQFLGEEAEGAPKPPPRDPGAAAQDGQDEGHDDDGHAHGADAGAATHDHAGAQEPAVAGFGAEADVLQEYGHTHDHAEAATLLDPETRATLKLALDQMWQSELNLRQGRPDLALPHAYRALEHIKKVQQAERIYLARVGPELPPIDEGRRLGGERGAIGVRALPLAVSATADPVPVAAWHALAPAATPGTPDLDALQRWLDGNRSRVADPLDLLAAIDAVRQQPDCASCRQALRALLWPAMTRPPASVPRRDPAGDAGARYLESLRREQEASR